MEKKVVLSCSVTVDSATNFPSAWSVLFLITATCSLLSAQLAHAFPFSSIGLGSFHCVILETIRSISDLRRRLRPIFSRLGLPLLARDSRTTFEWWRLRVFNAIVILVKRKSNEVWLVREHPVIFQPHSFQYAALKERFQENMKPSGGRLSLSLSLSFHERFPCLRIFNRWAGEEPMTALGVEKSSMAVIAAETILHKASLKGTSGDWVYTLSNEVAKRLASWTLKNRHERDWRSTSGRRLTLKLSPKKRWNKKSSVRE